MTRILGLAQAAILVAGLSAPTAAWAQSSAVTPADIQTLQDHVFLAERDVNQLRSRDSSRATQLASELDDLRDEVIYEKVKLRKNENLTRNEYLNLRNRIDNVRSQAQAPAQTANTNTRTPASGGFGAGAVSGGGAASTPTNTTRTQPSTQAPVQAQSGTRTTSRDSVEIPAGTEMDVRLLTALSSGTAQVEDRFEATTVQDLVLDGRVVVPTGSVLRGVVSSVDPATRTNRTGKLTVTFDQITVNGRAYPLRGTVTQALQSSGIKGEAGKIGVGAGVGAILGGILGGAKGALAGILIGGGGTIAATEGKDVDIPQGSELRVRVESPVQIRGR